MNAAPVIVTPADSYPLSVAEARAHCHVAHDEHDAYLEALIGAAFQWLQPPAGWLGRSILSQTLRQDLRAWPYREFRLTCGPVSAISSVKYFDQDNVLQTVSPSSYFLDGETLIFAAAFAAPSLYCRPGAVQIEYVAGYAGADAVPKPIRQAMLLLIGHWYENREAVTVGDVSKHLEVAVDALCFPFRKWS